MAQHKVLAATALLEVRDCELEEWSKCHTLEQVLGEGLRGMVSPIHAYKSDTW